MYALRRGVGDDFGGAGERALLVEIDRRLLDGGDLPPFVEEAPTLATPEAFEPRDYEGSDDPGTLVQDVTTGMMRTEVVRFGFEGGDPALGAPRVRVQVDPGDGTFVDVSSRVP